MSVGVLFTISDELSVNFFSIHAYTSFRDNSKLMSFETAMRSQCLKNLKYTHLYVHFSLRWKRIVWRPLY